MLHGPFMILVWIANLNVATPSTDGSIAVIDARTNSIARCEEILSDIKNKSGNRISGICVATGSK